MRTRGTGTIRKDGYIEIKKDKVSRLAHVLIAEAALGKPLPKQAHVHHFDENPQNNHPSNLVICPDAAYHQLLHRRMRAMQETGNPNLMKCQYCKSWDEPENIKVGKRVKYHASCKREYEARRTSCQN